MKKLLGIVLLGLLLSGNAYAEKIFLKCELTGGIDNWKDKSKNGVYRKGDKADVGLEINTKSKKIFDTFHSDVSPDISNWDDNSVEWKQQPTTLLRLNNYTLNRLTGKLLILRGYHNNNPLISEILNYKCSTAKKLF